MKDNWAERIATSYAEQCSVVIADRASPSDYFSKKTESPIERAFYTAFDLMHGLWYGRANPSEGLSTTNLAPQIFIQPQVQIGEFRVDFLCGWNIGDRRFTSVIVECDGHEFHERTKEQAARDKSRDRVLAEGAARVLRFTGSEIYKDPCACAAEVLQILDSLFWAWNDQVSK